MGSFVNIIIVSLRRRPDEEDDERFLERLSRAKPLLMADTGHSPVYSSRIQQLRDDANTALVSDDDYPEPTLSGRNRSILGHNPYPLQLNETFLPPSDHSYWPHDEIHHTDTIPPNLSDLHELPPWPDDLLSTHEILLQTFPDSDSFLLGDDDWLVNEVMNSSDLATPARRKPGRKLGKEEHLSRFQHSLWIHKS